MDKPKFSHKVVAIFLTLIFLPSLLPMNYVFASNNGPTAPEATSFEPIDAKDMVNLSTGDLSYVMPLLNVPSPEGGYPITLSYHAGIAMDQEASWIGMGWSLNPGAINRNVSGVPDDWKEGTKADVIYGIGGESESWSFGANLGYNNVSIGVSISESSNRAFGGEGSYSSSSSARIGASLFGIGGYAGTEGVGLSGELYGVNGSLGTDGASLGYSNANSSVGASTSFKTGLVSASASTKSVGISLGSNYGSLRVGQSNVSFRGSTSVSSALSLEITGFMAIIPFGNIASINYDQRKTRYWIYDRLGYDGIGSLYADNLTYRSNIDPLVTQSHFDAYESTFGYNSIPEYKNSNYTFVSYDDYNVNAQGMTGSMKPSIFEVGTLKTKFRQINLSSDDDVQSGPSVVTPTNNFEKRLAKNENGIFFNFENFNASHLRLRTDPWNVTSSINDFGSKSLSTTFDAVTDEGQSNYNSTIKRVYKGNFVETFTNRQLNASLPSGFIDTDSKGFIRSAFSDQKENDGIGAFKITSLDGKTYHYSLPVYQKEKFSRNSEKDRNITEDFFEEQTLDSYATHWLLTAVTGPDYIDINNDHRVDNQDYGYWVNFEYGKWSDGYSWRNPPGNDSFSENEKSKSYQWGVKEIYYLNKINTRTHSAFFVKQEREDDMSTPIRIGRSRTDMKRYSQQVFGYTPGNVTIGRDGYYLKGAYQNIRFGNPVDAVNARAGLDDFYYIKTNQHRSLKLNKILVYKNQDIPNDILTPKSGESAGTLKSEIYIRQDIEFDTGSGTQKNNRSKTVTDKQYFGEYYNNVLDVHDVNQNTLENGATKVIDFVQDYSLFSNTPNSTLGKLSLNRVFNKGKNGVALLPPYSFSYNGASYNRNIDDWGYPSNPAAGSLDRILTPIGAQIDIEYERDDYHREIIPTRRVLDEKLQFTFSTLNNKLRIIVENEEESGQNLHFDDFFEQGKTDFDFWSCYVKDYFASGCQSRRGTIDIANQQVDVISVNQNSMILETSLNFTNDSNGGLAEQFSYSPFGLNYHPGLIVANKFRGECENPSGCINVNPRMVLDYYLYSNKDITDVDGGGVRVRKINTINSVGEVFSKNYFYNDPDYNRIKYENNYRSSGITSYAPAKYSKEVKYVKELPSPFVIYEYVTIEKNSNGKFDGRTQYKFKVPKNIMETESSFELDDILSIEKEQDVDAPLSLVTSSGNSIPYNANYSKYVLHDNLSSIGSLLNMTTYNEFDQKLNITENKYKPKSSNAQGVFEESFKNIKVLREKKRDANNNVYLDRSVNFVSSSKIVYPNVLESVKTIQGNIDNTSYNDVFDFNTGQVLETRMENSKNVSIKNKVVPAYTKYPAMGTKSNALNNKNMLSQQCASYSYVNINGQWKETGVGITTWKPWNNGVFRKHKNYVWDGEVDIDGTLENFTDDFNWSLTNSNQNGKWTMTSETTKYNEFSMPLESKDVNDVHFTTKMNNPKDNIILTGNAPYKQIFYSGAEDLYVGSQIFGGEVLKGTADVVQQPHTGLNSMLVTTGKKAFEVTVDNNTIDGFIAPPQEYKISLWAKADNNEYENTRVFVGSDKLQYNEDEIVRAGDWVLLNFYKSFSGVKQIYVGAEGGNTIVDDFRVHPISAKMNTYVYNQWDELTNILGANNLATSFEYDDAGRLLNSSAEIAGNELLSGGLEKNSEYKYNYKRVAEIDANNNGIIDGSEGYSMISVTAYAENGYSAPGQLTISPTGGSGQYAYRYAQGIATSSQEIAAINSYGPETQSNTFFVSTVPCRTTSSNAYNAYIVRTRVRDVVTGDIETHLAIYNKSCSGPGGGGDGGGGEPQQ